MSDLNQCQFIGRLGADPEIKSFSNGGKVANLRIAVGAQWKDRDGNKQERTEWIPVTIQGDGLIGVAERFLSKGSRIFVQGEWCTRKWTDRDGNDRYSTECVVGFGGKLQMLDGKRDDSQPRQQSGGGGYSNQSNFDDGLDDDVPFISNSMIFEGRLS